MAVYRFNLKPFCTLVIAVSEFQCVFFSFINFSTMNIYVGNLSWQMTDEDLRNLFEQHGAVGSAKIVKDKVSGRSKGFGFVEMENDTEAQAAITSLYDSEVMGRKIIVNESQPKQQGSGGGGFKKRSFGNGGGGGGYKKGGFNRGNGGGGGFDRDY
jgi:RNA recognition motif-containing protein